MFNTMGTRLARWGNAFPFISPAQSLILMRVAVAIFFMAHAIVRIINGTTPQFAAFLAFKGLPWGIVLVWMITVYELAAGTLMALGIAVRCCVAGFLIIDIGGIVLIHAALGWFVGEHGVGGMEYSLCLLVALIAIAAHDRSSTK
jgi:putative oxidoreductase